MAVASKKNPEKPEVDHKEQEHHQEGLDHRPPSLDPPPRRTQPTSDPLPLAEPSLPLSYPSPIPSAPDLPPPLPSVQMDHINLSGRDVLSDQCRKTSAAGYGGAMGKAETAVDVPIVLSTTAVVLASVGRLQFKFAVHES